MRHSGYLRAKAAPIVLAEVEHLVLLSLHSVTVVLRLELVFIERLEACIYDLKGPPATCVDDQGLIVGSQALALLQTPQLVLRLLGDLL